MQGNHNTNVKRIVDVCMTVLLLCLMAYQVTGEGFGKRKLASIKYTDVKK